jgi:anthraniloyl-CoA monooxygenase
VTRILTIGGGPAGLYASSLIKTADPDAQVTLLERNPAGATYGWGVVFSDRTLAEFREADLPTYEAITEGFVLWDAIDVIHRGELIRSGGHAFAGIARKRLLGILQERCRELGVEVRFAVEVEDLARAEDFDLVIGADGVNSLVRTEHEEAFGPRIDMGRSRYIWFGTHRVLDSFTFIFRENDHGLFQVHAYPFDGTTSTWIVETDGATWRRAGLDTAGERESIGYCEKLFAEELRGHALLSNNSKWISFATLRSRTWRHRNLVLLGDAAHTAHFSIGSGTKLAMEDAIALARGFRRHPGDLGAAAADYEVERKPVVERFQEAADESRSYFENTGRYLHQEPMQFAFHLFTRSGRIDYDDMRRRDAAYVDRVDRWFAGGVTVAPSPMLTPLRLGALTVRNRVAAAASVAEDADDGVLGEGQRRALTDAAARGAGLVVGGVVAASPEGRVTPGDAGLYEDGQAERWATAAEAVHGTGGLMALRLGHAGRRGATRTRERGVDRPLDEGVWPLMAASPLPYGRRSQTPRQMDDEDMAQVAEDFALAAARAAGAGVDILLVHMAHGYLLHSFLSTLTNRRDDEYGGDLDGRMRFPLRVWDAVEEAWPGDRPRGAVIPATDWARGGWGVEDAVALSRALRERGCALIEPVAGGLVPHERPRYGRAFLAEYSDRVRNEARVATMTGGYITTTDLANTLLAGGRADLCLLTPS